MGKNTEGSALKRVLNRSLGYTEMLSWASKETVDLDDSYKRLLAVYDSIPDVRDAWGDLKKRHGALTAKLRELETTHVTNAPQPRKDHQGKIEAQIIEAQKLKTDAEKETTVQRTKALKTCAAVRTPAGASNAQAVRLSQQRDKLTTLLPKTGLTLESFDKAEQAQKELDKLAKDIVAEIAARQGFEQHLAQVSAALNAAAGKLNGAAESHLRGLLAAASTKGANATQATGWKQATTDLDAVAATTTQAVTYVQQHDRLSKLAANYTTAAPTQTARLTQLINDAVALAAGHDYAGAALKLDDFEADPHTQDVQAFYSRLKTFRDHTRAIMGVLEKKGIPNVPANLKPNNELAAIKNTCIGNAAPAAYQAATTALGVFEQRLADNHAYALRYSELDAFKASPAFALLDAVDQTALTTAMSSAKTLADANPGDPAQALAGLQPPAIDLNKVAKPATASKLAAQASALHAKLAVAAPGEAPTVHVKTLLDGANAELLSKKFDVADGLFNALLPIARSALAYAERLKDARTAIAAVVAPGKPDVLKPATDKAATQDYAGALALLDTGLTTLAAFEGYQARLDEATQLKAALPSTATEALAQLDELMKDADALAKTRAYADAQAVLASAANLPELAGPHKDVSAYLDIRQALDKPYTSAHAGMALPEAKAFLQTYWTEAASLAGQHKHKDALQKLQSLQGHLAPARSFSAERKSAQAVSKSLVDLEAAGKSVYAGTDKADLATWLTQADVEARKGDFAKALAELAAFRAKARGLCATAATDHDTNDGSANVHPHSVAKHLNVTDADKETRVKTGVPPPPTQAASSFDDAESWMAAREAALDAGKSRSGPNLTDVNPHVPDKTTLIIHIEHNRPIGSAMIGVQQKTAPKQAGPNKGELGGNNTYERAVKFTGYTRSTSIFRFDANEGATGKWVMLTQYPYTDDWDAERGCYTAPMPLT